MNILIFLYILHILAASTDGEPPKHVQKYMHISQISTKHSFSISITSLSTTTNSYYKSKKMRSVTLLCRWILPCSKWHRRSRLPPQCRDVSLNTARHINGRVTKSVDIFSNLYISMEMHECVLQELVEATPAQWHSRRPRRARIGARVSDGRGRAAGNRWPWAWLGAVAMSGAAVKGS
jgi:hypothetical protein